MTACNVGAQENESSVYSYFILLPFGCFLDSLDREAEGCMAGFSPRAQANFWRLQKQDLKCICVSQNIGIMKEAVVTQNSQWLGIGARWCYRDDMFYDWRRSRNLKMIALLRRLKMARRFLNVGSKVPNRSYVRQRYLVNGFARSRSEYSQWIRLTWLFGSNLGRKCEKKL